jgi:hypothetical protein
MIQAALPEGHFTPEGIEFLKQAMIIVATCDLHEPLVLFGSDEVERWKITDLTHGAAMVIKVTSFAELQAAIALIRKHRGRADTDGQPWFDL